MGHRTAIHRKIAAITDLHQDDVPMTSSRGLPSVELRMVPKMPMTSRLNDLSAMASPYKPFITIIPPPPLKALIASNMALLSWSLLIASKCIARRTGIKKTGAAPKS